VNLTPHFQSIRDMFRDGAIIGYEALIRGTRGESAKQLFKAAVHLGAVETLDEKARELAIEQGTPLLDGEQKLFVNIAAQTLTKGLIRLPPDAPLSKIVLEITEQMKIPNMNSLKDQLGRLKERGLLVALDDFGHGFNNLSTISELKPHSIKLDIALVRKVGDHTTANLLMNFVALCHNLNIKVIAEGVEQASQMERLRNIGVRYMQGFWFEHPKARNKWLPHLSLMGSVLE